MKEIKITGDWKDDATLISSTKQNCNQFENFGCYIYRLEDGRTVFYEDQMNESTYYLLEDGDSLEAKDYAKDWALSTDSCVGADWRTEMISWGLSDGDDYAVTDDFEGECCVIKVGNFYGYSPVKIISSYDVDGGNNENHVFASKEEAQEWIDEQEGGVYYTEHNEAGRPSYYIVEY
jgi:hypothetical protein